MKRTLLTTFAAMLLTVAAAAQETNRIYLKVGSLDNLGAVPLELYLDAPSQKITAVELYLTLPTGATLTKGMLAEGCASSHALVEGATAHGHFVSIASNGLAQLASSSEVPVCSWSMDLSSLAIGDYTLLATGLFAVGVADGTVTVYTAEDQTLSGTTTGIASPSAPSQGTLRVYTLGGQRLDAPQRGEVNIVNGRKVRF